MTWAGLVVYMREKRRVFGFRLDKTEGKVPLVRPGHRWWDIKRILNKSVGRSYSEFTWLKMERSVGVL